jgi:DNA-binding beta-propeller fold protein YncE
VADFDNNKVRVIDLTSYETSTLIAQQGFQRPFGLAFAPDGTLYVSTDNDENGRHSLMTGAIWRIPTGSQSAMLIVSGIGRPRGLAVLPDGRLAAADYVHHVVEIVDPLTGIVSPLAGAWDVAGMANATGTQARFAAPYGLAVTADGRLVVADHDNHALRLLTLDGITTTLTGTGVRGFRDGDLGAAMFHHPQAVTIAANGDIYVADSDNFRIRRIAGATVQTIAGDGTAGYRDSDDPLSSRLYGLEGLAIVPDGSMVYLADGSRGEDVPFHRVRQVAKHW